MLQIIYVVHAIITSIEMKNGRHLIFLIMYIYI